MIENLCGLAVCGGSSSRMKTDKSLLQYHGKPQWQYLYGLLQPFCKDVYLSCNEQQAASIPSSYKVIVDNERYKDMGPLTGVLSAQPVIADASLLIIGCDYPLIDRTDVELLLDSAQNNRSVTFRNEDGFIEPLVSVFLNDELQRLSNTYQQFNCSLRQFIEANNFLVLDHPLSTKLKSIDTPEEYHEVMQQLASNKGSVS